jgi:hypothetical protein
MRVVAGPTVRQAKQAQHWDDRKSQRRCVTRRICPRRSGRTWQERMWNRLNREEQMTSDACRLVRPGAAAQWSPAQNSLSTSSMFSGTFSLPNPVLAQQAVHAHGARHKPNRVRLPPVSQTPRTASPPLPPRFGRFTRTHLRFDTCSGPALATPLARFASSLARSASDGCPIEGILHP